MSKYRILWVLGAGLVAWLTGSRVWGDGDDREGFTRAEWETIGSLSPLPALPVDTTNKYRDSPAAALLGQKLFFEPRLSGPIQTGTRAEGQLGAVGESGKIACRKCAIWSVNWPSNSEAEKSLAYQFVIEPSGRKYVCARFVTGCAISAICFNCAMSSSTPNPGRSFGKSLPFLKSRQTGRCGSVRP